MRDRRELSMIIEGAGGYTIVWIGCVWMAGVVAQVAHSLWCLSELNVLFKVGIV